MIAGEFDEPRGIVRRKINRTANPAMKPSKGSNANSADTFEDIGLDELERLAIFIAQLHCLPHVKRRVRPSRLSQVLDRGTYPAIPFDQKNVRWS